MGTCNDGTEWEIKLPGGQSSNWDKCGRRGGKLRCPSSWPYMCVDRFCKKDPKHCFTHDNGHGGIHQCPKSNTSIEVTEMPALPPEMPALPTEMPALATEAPSEGPFFIEPTYVGSGDDDDDDDDNDDDNDDDDGYDKPDEKSKEVKPPHYFPVPKVAIYTASVNLSAVKDTKVSGLTMAETRTETHKVLSKEMKEKGKEKVLQKQENEREWRESKEKEIELEKEENEREWRESKEKEIEL